MYGPAGTAVGCGVNMALEVQTVVERLTRIATVEILSSEVRRRP